jgi:transcriptional regulator with XRE-family HTH domain
MPPNNAAQLLADARTRAGFSQRQLARLAKTAQSVVARIELGETSPSWATLTRLLAAAGFTLAATLKRRRADPQELDDVARILRLTPEQRLIEVARASAFISAARPKDEDDVVLLRAIKRARK